MAAFFTGRSLRPREAQGSEVGFGRLILYNNLYGKEQLPYGRERSCLPVLRRILSAGPEYLTRFFRWPCGGTTEGAGRAGQLLNALGLWKEALREGHLGPEVHGEPHLGFFAWDGKSPLGNLIDLENSYWNPREVTFGGLVSPGMGGNLPSPAKDFKQSRDRSHGSTCSSQVQGQNARTQPGLVTASREPRPPPQLGTLPCLPGQRQVLAGGGRLTFHGSGLDRGGAE